MLQDRVLARSLLFLLVALPRGLGLEASDNQSKIELHKKARMAVPWLRNLPAKDKAGHPYPRSALVTIVTQGGCEDPSQKSNNGKYGYIAGAYSLLDSARKTGTALRTILILTTNVLDHEAIAAQATALGHEAAMLPSVHGVESFLQGKSLEKKPLGAHTGSQWNVHTSRWFGKYTTLHLWAQKDLFDTIIFADSDHLVLKNIDQLVNICAGSTLCAVNDPTQAPNKNWDGMYFNSGMIVLHPHDDDFNGLRNAFVNNSLTSKIAGKKFDPDAFFSMNEPHSGWFTGGKHGSLFEQDLYNAYFANRTTYLLQGYNMWARLLDTKLEPGQYFRSEADIETYLKSRLWVLHGNLWDKSDGYGYNFPASLRNLWLNQWKETAKKLAATGPSACGDGRVEKCVACASDECWYKCIGVT